jgi:hypothetical protein
MTEQEIYNWFIENFDFEVTMKRFFPYLISLSPKTELGEFLYEQSGKDMFIYEDSTPSEVFKFLRQFYNCNTIDIWRAGKRIITDYTNINDNR